MEAHLSHWKKGPGRSSLTSDHTCQVNTLVTRQGVSKRDWIQQQHVCCHNSQWCWEIKQALIHRSSSGFVSLLSSIKLSVCQNMVCFTSQQWRATTAVLLIIHWENTLLEEWRSKFFIILSQPFRRMSSLEENIMRIILNTLFPRFRHVVLSLLEYAS